MYTTHNFRFFIYLLLKFFYNIIIIILLLNILLLYQKDIDYIFKFYFNSKLKGTNLSFQ